jgi:hypothetical protein
MSSRETLDFVVSFLVDNPDDVRIEETDQDDTIIYDLIVHPDDIGKVIGRNGRTARSLRTIVKAAASKEDRNAVVDIID